MFALAASVGGATLSQHSVDVASSATVIEFLCLFTHDLRRKAKRWQDGRLKFHTFNKRVMVYDERGNFIGDTHWHLDQCFNEGEELHLDRGGVIVQVQECAGEHSQDLSQLLKSRVREERARDVTARSFQSTAIAPSHNPSAVVRPLQDHFLSRHRPLQHVLGMPGGHHDRSGASRRTSIKEKQMSSSVTGRDDERPPKRLRRDNSPKNRNSKRPYAQGLFGAVLTLSGGHGGLPQSGRLNPFGRQAGDAVPGEAAPLGSNGTLASAQTNEDNGPSKHIGTSTYRPQERMSPALRTVTSKQREASEISRMKDTLSAPHYRDDQEIHCQVRRDLIGGCDLTHTPALQTTPVGSVQPNSFANRNGKPAQLAEVPLSNREDKSRRVQTRVRERGPESEHEVSTMHPSLPRHGRNPMTQGTSPGKQGLIAADDERERPEATGSPIYGAEPKTELRIKSTKRRGLMLVSETHAGALGQHRQMRAETGRLSERVSGRNIQYQNTSDAAPPVQPHPGQEQDQVSYPEAYQRPNNRRSLSSNESGSSMRGAVEAAPLKRTVVQKERGKNACEDLVNAPCNVGPSPQDVDVPTLRSRPGRDPREKTAQYVPNLSTENQQSEGDKPASRREAETLRNEAIEPPEVQPGPHLAAFRRKGVRSKEVIGLSVKSSQDDRLLARSASGGERLFNMQPIATIAGLPAPAARECGHGVNQVEGIATADSAPVAFVVSTRQDVSPPCHQKISTTAEVNTAREPSVAPALLEPTGPPVIEVAFDVAIEPPVTKAGGQQPLPQSDTAMATGIAHSRSTSGEEPTKETPVTAPAAPRLANPATRGRKAATKSDAAGQVPRPVLLPTTVPQQDLGRGATEGTEGKRTMKFPGFVSAKGGGPWSREAADLLERGRPA